LTASPVEHVALLIVEDELDLRDALETRLEPLCSKIFLAANGMEALEIIKTSADLCAILSDINMPIMNGLELLAKVRRTFNPIPFVVLTGYGDDASHQEAIRLNATDFLSKPFQGDHLAQVMKRALNYGAELLKIEKELDVLFKSSEMTPEKLESLRRAKRTAMAMRIESSIYANLKKNT
jgi:CheY-like chemotaxis protein